MSSLMANKVYYGAHRQFYDNSGGVQMTLSAAWSCYQVNEISYQWRRRDAKEAVRLTIRPIKGHHAYTLNGPVS